MVWKLWYPVVLLFLLDLFCVEGRGRGGGRGGRSRTGSRHSTSNLRFSAVGINRNPIKLIAILPFGSSELNSYPAREGYFPCPQSGGSFHSPTESDTGATEVNNLVHTDEVSSSHINGDLLSLNQFVYICFNETKPLDEPIDVFDTTVAVVVILLIFGLIFDLTRRSAFQAPTTTFNSSSAYNGQTQRSESFPEIDQDHIMRIQRMARTSRRGTVSTAITSQQDPPLPPSSPPTSMSRKSSEDKPPSYTEVVNPPPSYEESVRLARLKMNQNAQRLLKK